MKNLFWNSEQRRVRALWRVVAQALLMMVLALFVLLPALILMTFRGPSPIWYMIGESIALMIVLFGVWLAGNALDRRRFADFGFRFNRGWWLDFGFGLFLGLALVTGIFLVEWNAGWIKNTQVVLSPWNPVAHALVIGFTVFIGALSSAVPLQLVSRGYQTRNLAEGLNLPVIAPGGALVIAYLVTSFIPLLPRLGHFLDLYGYFFINRGFFNESLLFVGNSVGVMLFLGLGYVLTRELAIPIGLSTGWAFSRGLLFGETPEIFGFPGVEVDPIIETFVRIHQVGPPRWVGENHVGFETGLLALLAGVVGSLLIVAWVRWRYGRVQLQDSLAQYERATPAELETR